jgi:hypothetical protein
MAKEEVTAFNKGFDRLIVQLKENSKIEQDEQRRSRIDELKAQNDAVIEAKKSAAATLEELKNLDKNDKENLKRLSEQHQTQKETIQNLEDARNDRKEEYKQAQETKNAILQMNNQTKEDAQTNKDTKSGIQEMKDALDKQKEEIESQGGVAKDSKSFQKATLDIAQKELNLRKASAKRDGVTKAGQEEIDKEQQRINKERGSTFKGILGGIKGLGASLEKVVGKTGVAALSGAAFLAIGAFLQSDTFQKMTDFIFDTLIPKLQEFYNAFFGPEGGFLKGFQTLFGDESGIGSIVLGIGTVLLLFAGFKIAGLALAVTSLLGGIKGLGGKKGIGRFLGKGGMLKGAVTAFAGLGASLKGFMSGITGFASKGLDMVKGAGAKLMESAKNIAKGALDVAKKGVSAVKTGAAALHSTPEKAVKGVGKLGAAMGKDVASGAGKAAQAVKGTGAKLTASASKVFKAFPRLGLAAKLVPGLGAALAAGQGIAILMDDSMSKDDKIKAFGGLLGGTLGSAGFAALGGLLGTAAFPGVGTIAGGLLGGALGYFGGDYAGRKAATFLLGDQTEEEKVAKQLEGGGSSGDTKGSGGFSSDATVGGTTGMDISQGSTKAKVSTYKGKPTESMIAKRMKAGLDREQATNTPQQFDIMKSQGGMGNTTIINNNTTNAPVNNNSTTSTVNSIVESDPMFNRNSRYAI